MRKLSFLLLTLAVTFTSCQKDDLTITFKQSGDLTVKVLDENKNPLESAKILIGGYSSSIVDETTDSSGTWTGRLLQDTYYCTVIKKKGQISYKETKLVQVIAEENTILEISPFDNVGEISIQLENYNGNPLPTLKMLLVPNENGNGRLPHDYLDVYHFLANTDSMGKAKFSKVPAGVTYILAIYDENKEILIDYEWVNASRGEEKRYTFGINYYES